MTEGTELLILGLGNVLCRDDGLGIAAVHRLDRLYDPPPGVRILDGGTLGLGLLPWLRSARRAILVDAVRTGDPPGCSVRIEGRDVAPAVLERLSVHQVGVADLLDAARWLGDLPDRIVLLGLVPATLELGVGRSARVEARIPDLVDRIVEEAARHGHPLQRRRGDATSRLDAASARALGL